MAMEKDGEIRANHTPAGNDVDEHEKTAKVGPVYDFMRFLAKKVVEKLADDQGITRQPS